MNVLFTIVVTFFAGMGAGLGTGFAGMSAAAVISPMLIAFLGMDPYMAVGIALSSDVLASAVSAYTYHKNKNLDIKNGLIMMVSVLVFTVVGSYLASLLPSATMGSFSVFMTFLLGIKFIVRPVMTTKEAMQGVSAKKRAIQSVVFDAYRVPGSPGVIEQYHNIHVVYTKEAETADMFIEHVTHEIGKGRRVRVATSDGMEQIIILGHGALRVSARMFHQEVQEVEKEIRNYLQGEV